MEPSAAEHMQNNVHESGGETMKEMANFVSMIAERLHGTSLSHFLHAWENVIFSWIGASFIIFVFFLGTRKKSIVPSGLQNVLEMIVEALENLVVGVIGPKGREYVPFIGTLFIYIFVQNWMGLIPGLKSPTSSINTTAGLSITVFFYVQYVGLRENGIKNYILHLMGSPKDTVGWCMVPLNFPLHILEEFIRPLSLSLRLFGNVFGEDALIGVFSGLGILALSKLHSPIGIPFQLPFMMLAMLTGTIQALVFSLLSTIYLSLMLPHDDHEHGHETAHQPVHQTEH